MMCWETFEMRENKTQMWQKEKKKKTGEKSKNILIPQLRPPSWATGLWSLCQGLSWRTDSWRGEPAMADKHTSGTQASGWLGRSGPLALLVQAGKASSRASSAQGPTALSPPAGQTTSLRSCAMCFFSPPLWTCKSIQAMTSSVPTQTSKTSNWAESGWVWAVGLGSSNVARPSGSFLEK